MSVMSRLLLSRALRAACAAVLLGAGPAAADACAAGAAGADLAVFAADPAPVHDGGSTLLHPVVTNTGGTATAVPFTLYVHLPPGVAGTGKSPGATCTTLPHGHTVACTVPAGLAPGAPVTAEVRISVASGMDPEVLDGNVEAELADDPTPENNSSTFRITVI
ncbi:hypothetical protein [Kitasatospora purpeofusca]|uniref:DUF11 domain-containing protein n=1 Tax=Kitasatospora purpeofusca TaxID=67352 RepID=A0ABZ1UAR4_9ACTN|nr:hypothetical protein [Kitasatospora purpeofusca]